MNAAIVSTHKTWDRHGGDWAEYHLAQGFSKIYVYVDGERPEVDVDIPGVDVIFCGAEYWRSHVPQAGYREHLSQVQAAIGTAAWGSPESLTNRQVLNTCCGLDRARAEGVAWLLHIDDDERFWCPGVAVMDHFEDMTERGIIHAHYWNHEAVVLPGGDTDDRILLKKNWEALSDEQRSLIPSLCSGKPYFVSYSNGKSAARIDRSTEPHGAHYFKSADVPPSASCEMSNPAICHMPYRSVDHFCDKHLSLGTFDNRLFGVPWFPQQVYSEARECVRRGDVAGLRKLYLDRVLVGSAELDALAKHDFLIEANLARVGMPA
ncbi:hypothetical protein GWC77_23325 [Paraburkholderia sp. NMBU_R16]|uniref:hypothetical protein n=1 Tax=Paraburkholderia sp. NMBU_R16 TaxID=2698676 RepID=UPI00156790B6|nr:hypothetical protein [Paraburkholderia sp. NMBU_R16]NRO98847.1 hypothetical protein [Paraburkholderia sp. NMBU_R16]